MFSLNSLYNKYFAMNTSFRISLLYLLLIIPQHGNSPLPVMESWLQKDQDDGSVQRDMTSSLTGGDESFGSAHQTYQNSLIRKKKSDNPGNTLPAMGYRKFTAKADRSQRFQQPNVFFDGRYMSNDYNAQMGDSQRDDGIFEEFDSDSGLPSDKYRGKLSNLRNPNDANLNPRSLNKYSAMVPSKDVIFYNSAMNGAGGDSERNINPLADDMGRSAKWSLCKRLKQRYAPNPPVGFSPQSMQQDRGAFNLDDTYLNLDDDRRGREISNQEYRDAMQINNRPEGKNPQIFDESAYYDVEANAVPGEEDLNMEEDDYNQILNHAYMQKRDDTRQMGVPRPNNANEQSEATKMILDSLKTRVPARGFGHDAISIEAVKDDMAGTNKARDADNPNMKVSDSDLIWKLNSGLQSKALHDVMKSSQRALQEVQMFQQKLALKSPENNGNGGLKRESRNQPLLKCEKKNLEFDDKRSKREDEDEQKNMKTGTDEGGGGEYEDEEGKGHKDEEEYYEDADLSDDESGNDVRTSNGFNQKYVKREVIEDAKLKNSKEEQNDNTSSDYELNLENAPVENAEKSRKSSLHGEDDASY